MLPKETLGESYLIGSATTIERVSGDRRLLERVLLTKGEVLFEGDQSREQMHSEHGILNKFC